MGPSEVRLGPGPYGGAATARALGVDTGLSASTVDGYRSCPRRCYLERVLKVGDPEAVGYDLDPRERGDWLHRLLRHLFVTRPGWWHGAPNPERIREMLRALEDPGVWGRGVAASGDFLELQAQRSLDALSDRLALHGAVMDATPAQRPVGVEVEVRLAAESDTDCPPLRGTLDRLDLILGPDGLAKGFLVFDYKTGRVGGYSASRDNASRKQQLFLYAVLMEGLIGLPCLGTLAISLLGDEKPSGAIVTDQAENELQAWVEASKKRDRITREELEQAMADARAAARDVAAGISDARFPAEPNPPNLC
ncbi:MAG: PD-(D/E)XK nuclease family protein, partial [Myxococcota bacterium]|nr:PD-(D/E)XK nuclease family protein [Myxococcota bacterium]